MSDTLLDDVPALKHRRTDDSSSFVRTTRTQTLRPRVLAALQRVCTETWADVLFAFIPENILHTFVIQSER
jgi:hypothetical protein